MSNLRLEVETVDVYLAALKKLATLFGGLPERALAYAFLAGFPDRVKQLLQANSSVNTLALDKLMDQSRTILKDSSAPEESFAAVAQPRQSSVRASPRSGPHAGIICYKCKGQGHMARNCASEKRQVRCFRCNEAGHMARNCLRNEARTRWHQSHPQTTSKQGAANHPSPCW